jgi:hypothetical protein
MPSPSESKKSIDGYVGQPKEILIAERQKGVVVKIDLAKYCV